MRTSLIVIGLLALAQSARAQSSVVVQPFVLIGPPAASHLRAGARAVASTHGVSPLHVQARADEGRFAARLLSASGGAAVGILAGMLFSDGFALFGDCGDGTGGCEAFHEALVASIIGAGIGAAVPRSSSPCTFGPRLGRGLLGAAAGGALGFAVGGGSDGLAFPVPIGAVLGGAFVAARC